MFATGGPYGRHAASCGSKGSRAKSASQNASTYAEKIGWVAPWFFVRDGQYASVGATKDAARWRSSGKRVYGPFRTSEALNRAADKQRLQPSWY